MMLKIYVTSFIKTNNGKDDTNKIDSRKSINKI